SVQTVSLLLNLCFQFFFRKVYDHSQGNGENNKSRKSQKLQPQEQRRQRSQRVKPDLFTHDPELQHIPHHQDHQVEEKDAEGKSVILHDQQDRRPGKQDTACTQHRQDIKYGDPQSDKHRIGNSHDQKPQTQFPEGYQEQKAVGAQIDEKRS